MSVFLATGMWFGLVPFAPGTVGALWGLPLAWAISKLPELWQQIAIIVVIAAVGIPLCTNAAQRMGGLKDPGSIVFDEIASLPMTFFMIPMDHSSVVLAGFVLHRLFDISKPPPARAFERFPAGLGIMADDWIAGLYSNLALQLLLRAGALGL